jgi:hypothetical protein
MVVLNARGKILETNRATACISKGFSQDAAELSKVPGPRMERECVACRSRDERSNVLAHSFE